MPQLPLPVLSLNESVNLLPSSDQKVKLYHLPSRFIWRKDSPAQYEAELHSTRVENMIDSFLLTSFSEDKKTINLATHQLTEIFSTVVRVVPEKKKKIADVKKTLLKLGGLIKNAKK